MEKVRWKARWNWLLTFYIFRKSQSRSLAKGDDNINVFHAGRGPVAGRPVLPPEACASEQPPDPEALVCSETVGGDGRICLFSSVPF